MTNPFNTDRTASYGAPEQIAPGIRRLTCENPSPYTFTGTHSYLVGTGDLALIDPGPAHPAHQAAILDAVGPGERISHILVTHTHLDHSPGAAVIAHETGAQTHAFGPHGAGMSKTMRSLQESGAEIGGGEGADPGFHPDHTLDDGDTVSGGDWALTAVHTPGHLSNHLSFALEGRDTVFTGDMVMGFATTLVSPPEGDMAAFMASLDRLATRTSDQLYLPGHGHPVADPAGMLAHQRNHRQQRLDQILAALEDGPSNAETLTRAIYTDVDPKLLPAAARNVLASLIGLADQDRVVSEGAIAANAKFRLA